MSSWTDSTTVLMKTGFACRFYSVLIEFAAAAAADAVDFLFLFPMQIACSLALVWVFRVNALVVRRWKGSSKGLSSWNAECNRVW